MALTAWCAHTHVYIEKPDTPVWLSSSSVWPLVAHASPPIATDVTKAEAPDAAGDAAAAGQAAAAATTTPEAAGTAEQGDDAAMRRDEAAPSALTPHDDAGDADKPAKAGNVAGGAQGDQAVR